MVDRLTHRDSATLWIRTPVERDGTPKDPLDPALGKRLQIDVAFGADADRPVSMRVKGAGEPLVFVFASQHELHRFANSDETPVTDFAIQGAEGHEALLTLIQHSTDVREASRFASAPRDNIFLGESRRTLRQYNLQRPRITTGRVEGQVRDLQRHLITAGVLPAQVEGASAVTGVMDQASTDAVERYFVQNLSEYRTYCEGVSDSARKALPAPESVENIVNVAPAHAHRSFRSAAFEVADLTAHFSRSLTVRRGEELALPQHPKLSRALVSLRQRLVSGQSIRPSDMQRVLATRQSMPAEWLADLANRAPTVAEGARPWADFLVDAALQDGRYSDAESSALVPILTTLPSRATALGDRLVRAYVSTPADGNAHYHLSHVLSRRGYDVDLGDDLPAQKRIDLILSAHVTSEDKTLTRLSRVLGRESNTVPVSVFDSGFEIAHEALRDKLWTNPKEVADGLDNDGDGRVDDLHGWDHRDNDGGLADDRDSEEGHGTHVASIATAGTERLQLVGARAFDNSVVASEILSAIEYAVKAEVRVVNMSFKIKSPELAEAVAQAMRANPNILFVLTAGNHGEALPHEDNRLGVYDIPNMMVVANFNREATLGPMSGYGSAHVSMGAIGTRVLAADTLGGYSRKTGTSMAAPQVSNAAGKVLLLNPELNTEQVRWVLENTVDEHAHMKQWVSTSGQLNIDRAMHLSALWSLVASGVEPEAAADQIGLVEPERARLLETLMTGPLAKAR